MLSKNKKVLSLTLTSFLTLAALSSETFRVSKVSVINLNTAETQIKCGINEAIAIKLPEDKTFLDGIEIKMDIPESVAYWQDSVACSIYDKISPAPEEARIDYTGTKKFVNTLPGKLSWVLQIPANQKNSFKSNQYTTIMDPCADLSSGYIFVRFQPVMKGISEETLNSQINLTIKQILIDKGQLELKLNTPLSKVSVFVDDENYSFNKNQNSSSGKILLDKGIHNVSIISDSFRNEVRTIRIDQAKKTLLEVEMKSIEPAIIVTAPQGTKVLLDDKSFTNFGVETVISEGDHKIVFSIGDYQIVRNLTVSKGKTYNVNFSVDLQISEE